MEEKTSNLPFILSLIGAILILINGIWIAANGAPILLSSSQISTIETLTGPNAPSWWRISFGLPGSIAGSLIFIWLIFAIVNLFSSLMLYIRPTKYTSWSLLILVCSILSIPIGGGFILGLILCIVGGGMGLEWPTTPRKTFIGKLIRAARLDSTLYKSIGEEPQALKWAALTIIFINFLSGFGNGLYTYNVQEIVKPPSPAALSRILLLGDIFWDPSAAVGPAMLSIGIALIKWLILTGIIYLVGVKIAGNTTGLDNIGRVVAFAYIPICLQVFMPFVLGSENFVKFQWPLAMFFITNIWMAIALVIGLKQSLNVGTRQAFGVMILGGTSYWLIVHFWRQLWEL